MKSSAVGIALLAALALATAPSPVTAEESSDAETNNNASQEATKPDVAATITQIYVPKPQPTPGRRVGGGTRGTIDPSCQARLDVLAPRDHTGLTTRADPVLYWYVQWNDESDGSACRIDFALSESPEQGVPRTVVQRTLPGPIASGVRRIRLADWDVELAQGVRYEWFVSVVRDADSPSNNIDAGGFIERVAAHDAVKLRGFAGAMADARDGIWYDAIAGLFESSSDEASRERINMLKGQGLQLVGAGSR